MQRGTAYFKSLPAAELVAELAKHRNTKDLGIRLAMIGIRAELDARRKNQLTCIGGIENSDGSFSFPPAEFMIYSVCIKDANETEWKSAINAAIEAITNEAELVQKELDAMTTRDLVVMRDLLKNTVGVTDTQRTLLGILEKDHDFMLAAYTAELDARCEKWRIGLNSDGGLVMASSENAHIGQQAHGVAVVSDLSEFRALLGYLEQRSNDGSGLRILKNLADENLQRVMGDDTKGGGK